MTVTLILPALLATAQPAGAPAPATSAPVGTTESGATESGAAETGATQPGATQAGAAALPAPVAPPATGAATPAAPAPDPAAGPEAASTPVPGQPAPIVVSGRGPPPKSDPLQAVNVKSFEVVQKVDAAVIQPALKGYEAVPRPLRDGLHNFVYNLTEPVVFVAFLLQLHPGKAAETAARFGINSTLGLGGLVDVAKRKPFRLPYRFNGLADTLAYYGVGPGPYMYLPLIGPTTVRDLLGQVADNAMLPLAVGAPFNRPAVMVPYNALSVLDDRDRAEADLKRVRESGDPYATYRKTYLQTRRWQIEALHGRGPLAKGAVGVEPFLKPPGSQPVVSPTAASQPPESQPAASQSPVSQPTESPPAGPSRTGPRPDNSAPGGPAPAPSPTFIAVPVVQPLP